MKKFVKRLVIIIWVISLLYMVGSCSVTLNINDEPEVIYHKL